MASGVLVDANVLFSRTLRDWLFLLKRETAGGMFTVFASEDIIAETLYALRRRHPEAPGAMITGIHDRIVEQIDERVVDFTVDGTYPGPDPHDAHVHAAAIACGARFVLTSDSGFTRLPDELANELPYEVHTADSLFVLIDDSAPQAVQAVVREQVAYWLSHRGEADLPRHLRQADCPLFADRVRQHLQFLD